MSQSLTERNDDRISGVLSCYDRLVIMGTVPVICYAEGMTRLIDVQQRGEALRSVQFELRHRFTGSMAWKERAGRDYLYRITGRVEKSLGPRSAETEAIYVAYTQGKPWLKTEKTGCGAPWKGWRGLIARWVLGAFPHSWVGYCGKWIRLARWATKSAS
jgi:hypothetical protein